MTVEGEMGLRKKPIQIDLAYPAQGIPSKDQSMRPTENKIEPIEIFTAQELRPTVKKTKRMLEVEKVIGEDLGQFLTTQYATNSLRDIRAAISNMSSNKVNIVETTITGWIRAYGIQTRSHLESIVLVWKNPEKRTSMIAKAHSPEANEKRSKAVSAHWQSLPEKEKQKRLKRLKSGMRSYEANRKLLFKQKMQEVLGKNPKKTLKRMHWIEGLSPNEIGQKIGVSTTTIIKWMERLGIERRKKGDGFIKIDKERKESIVERARKKNLLGILTEKENIVIDARYPPPGQKILSFSAIQQSYPTTNSRVTRQALQYTEKRALKKLARALINCANQVRTKFQTKSKLNI